MNKIYDTKLLQFESLLGFASGLGFILTDQRPEENMNFISVCPKIPKEFEVISIKTMIEFHNNVNFILNNTVKCYYGVGDINKLLRIFSYASRDVIQLAVSRKLVEAVKFDYSKRSKKLIFKSMIVQYTKKSLTMHQCIKSINDVFKVKLHFWWPQISLLESKLSKTKIIRFGIDTNDKSFTLNIVLQDLDTNELTELYDGEMLSVDELKNMKDFLTKTLD